MNPLELNKNVSTIFILPMVFEDLKYDQIVTKDFKNAYVADFSRPEFDDDLILVFKEISSIQRDAKATYEVKGDIVEVYEIPDKYLAEYFKIYAGQYSEISEELKQIILKFWDEDEESLLYKILYNLVENDHEEDIRADKVKSLIPEFRLVDEVFRMGIRL